MFLLYGFEKRFLTLLKLTYSCLDFPPVLQRSTKRSNLSPRLSSQYLLELFHFFVGFPQLFNVTRFGLYHLYLESIDTIFISLQLETCDPFPFFKTLFFLSKRFLFTKDIQVCFTFPYQQFMGRLRG